MSPEDSQKEVSRRGLLTRVAATLAVVTGGLAIKQSSQSESAQADSTTADLNYKARLPVVTVNFAEPTPTPTPENLALVNTVLVEKLKTVLNGRIYTVESRISADAPYQANVKPELSQQLVELVAKDGQRVGFNRAVILIVKTADQLPAGNQVTWTAVVPQDGQGKRITIGKTGSQWLSPDKILVYEFLPNDNLPYSSQAFRDSLNGGTANGFLRTTYFGDMFGEGNLDSEHVVLMNKNPILVLQR